MKRPIRSAAKYWAGTNKFDTITFDRDMDEYICSLEEKIENPLLTINFDRQAVLKEKFNNECVATRIVKNNRSDERYIVRRYIPNRGSYSWYILDIETDAIIGNYTSDEKEKVEEKCNSLNEANDANVTNVTVVTDVQTWLTKSPDEMWNWILKEALSGS